MRKLILLASIVIFYSANLFAQTTSPLPYCHAGFAFIGGDTTGSDWINSVQLGTLNNISNAESTAPHYIFYNNATIPDLSKNTSYTMHLNLYIGGGAGYAAWIDYNHDNMFDSTELIAGIKASTGIALGSSVPVVATITIPATALSGNTRMRIRVSEDDDYHAAHPSAYELACDSMDNTAYGGETEDYTVNILATAGVSEIKNNVTFSLYPNPANSHLTIDGNFTGSVTYAICDINGSKKLEGTITKTKDNIDVSALSTGLYFIEVATQGQPIKYEKFIKN